MGVAVSSPHVISAAPSSSGGGLLTLFPCSSVGSLPRETVLHELLQRESLPQATVLHELLQHGSLPRVQSFRNRLLQHGSPAGSQVLPANLLQRGLLFPWVHRSCQEPAPAWAFHRVTASFGHPPAPAWGPPQAAGGYLLHCKPSMGCRGTACLTMVFTTGCRGISALAPGAPPPPPSSLTLVSAELFLSHLLTPLCSCNCYCAETSSPS